MIDLHFHLGNLYRHSYPDSIGLSTHQLMERMNREGEAFIYADLMKNSARI